MTYKNFTHFLLISVIIALVLFFFHRYFFFRAEALIPLWRIYLFHLLVNLVVYTSVFFVSRHAFDKVGFAFMSLSVLKMLASIVFLLPIFLSEKDFLIPEVIDFFVPYFVFLLLEIVFTLKVLNLSIK